MENNREVLVSILGAGPLTARSAGFLAGMLSRAEGHIKISGLSGSSAGAIAAIVALNGYRNSSSSGAVEALWKFYHSDSAFVILEGKKEEVLQNHIRRIGRALTHSAANKRAMLDQIVQTYIVGDAASVNRPESPLLLINAKDEESGDSITFSNRDTNGITNDHIAAAICVPELFGYVRMNDGRKMSDGAYVKNGLAHELCQRHLREGGRTKEIVILGKPPVALPEAHKHHSHSIFKLHAVNLGVYQSEKNAIERMNFIIHECAPISADDLHFRNMFNYNSEKTIQRFETGFREGIAFGKALMQEPAIPLSRPIPAQAEIYGAG